MSKQSFDQLMNRLSYSFNRFAKEGPDGSGAAGGGKEPKKKEPKADSQKKPTEAATGLLKFLSTLPEGMVVWKDKVPEANTKYNGILAELTDGSQLMILQYATERLCEGEVTKASCGSALEKAGLTPEQIAKSSSWFPYMGLSKAKVLAAADALKERSA
jgi:hypothetical protein